MEGEKREERETEKEFLCDNLRKLDYADGFLTLYIY